MDALIVDAGRALAAGDPLAALRCIALREDAPALALRGIAMAQLGDFERAKPLLRRAARAFGTRDAVARARCAVAEAEIALAARDLTRDPKALAEAREVLSTRGDHANAAHAQLLEARFLLLVGRIDAAEQALLRVDPEPLPVALRAIHAFAMAGIAMRRIRPRAARAALARAGRFARQAGVPALIAEVEAATRALAAPAAHLLARDHARPITLDGVEALLASRALVVDACRYVVSHDGIAVALATRPLLFSLVRALAEAWPDGASREALIRRAFRLMLADATLRARLRVEIGRLRMLLQPIADVCATRDGFALLPHSARKVVVLARPLEGRHAAVLALLADGEAWSSSAIALVLGTSQRNVQRALDVLAAEGKIQATGRGRMRRWLTPPLPGFTTALLLPAPFETH